ncbi:MAG: radical SAM protein [Nanoarchaeota archaeon]
MTNNNLIYLVNAGNDPSMSAMSNDYSFPALGILALGTWLKDRLPDLEVLCRDGAVRPNESIRQEILRTKPMLVGVSSLCTSYQNSLDIAAAAKEAGSKVVFGNDQASQTSRLILENRSNVDYVIGAEYGELDLELLVRHLRGEKIDIRDIPTLTFRQDRAVAGFDFHNPAHKRRLSIKHPASRYRELWQFLELGVDEVDRTRALDMFPIVDRTLYPADHWQIYLKNYMQRFARLHRNEVTGVTTMNRARGCNRQGSAQCKHCDMLLDISMSSPEIFWKEVRKAHEQVNATSIYECCDSLSSFPGLIRQLAESRPSDLGFDPEFYVYCQAADLAEHPERVDMLRDIGVFRVNMGLESMSDVTLRDMKGEKDSVDKNYKALQLLKDRGIYVYASFVLGSERETQHTLFDETVPRVCELIRNDLICDAEAQPVLPLHGNYQGRVLLEHGLMTCEGQPADWPLNVDELSRRYIDSFSGVSHNDAVDAARMIRQCARERGINFGSGVSRTENYEDR